MSYDFATQTALHWGAVGCYIAATIALAYAVFFDHPTRVKFGTALAILGLVPHATALIFRWIESGHGPYMLRYEVLSSNAFVAVAMIAALLAFRPKAAPIAMGVLPIAFVVVAVSLYLNPEVRELPASLRSMWLVFHVTFAKLATGAFLLSLGSAVLLVWKSKGGTGKVLDRMPDAAALDAYTVRFIGFGFLFWTINVAAGAVWANEAWGRYWGWDVIETWSLITWLGYGTFLHARLFYRLSGRVIGTAAIVCFVVAVLTIFLLPLAMPSIHAAYFQ